MSEIVPRISWLPLLPSPAETNTGLLRFIKPSVLTHGSARSVPVLRRISCILQSAFEREENRSQGREKLRNDGERTDAFVPLVLSLSSGLVRFCLSSYFTDSRRLI